MRKIICSLAMALMIASVAFADEMITTGNLPALKGTWEGMISWGVMGAANSNVRLEIFNDTVPVRARLTLSNVPDAVSVRILGAMGGTQMIDNDEGEITTQGTLMFVGASKNWMEFSMAKANKLNGNFYVRGVKGDLTVFKK